MRLKAQLSQEPRTMHKSRPISSGESCEYEILHHSSLSVYVLECVCARATLLQSCPTLLDVIYCSLPNSSVHGILQAGILEWVAMPSFGDLSNPGIKPTFLRSPALSGEFFTTSTTWEVLEVFKFRSYQKWKIWSRNLNLLNHILFEWGWH